MRALVLGIGDRSRGDDGAGPEVAARVLRLGLPGVQVLTEVEPLALVEHLPAFDDVVVVDASRPAGRPGRIHVWRVGLGPLALEGRATGTHALGVGEAVELARALGRLPARLTLVGVEARSCDLGSPLSPAVRLRLDDAVGAVVAALATAENGAG